MNLSDFLIIYLACGAPCGVYFFLQNRKKLSTGNLWLKSFLTVFVWIPYAFRLLHDFYTRRKLSRRLLQKSDFDKQLADAVKRLVALFQDSKSRISVFETREVVERYAGLTVAWKAADADVPDQKEKEIFRISLRQNATLATICLHRRNRTRLSAHQNQARLDFLQIVAELKSSAPDRAELKKAVFDFVELIGDREARKPLANALLEEPQSPDRRRVSDSEKVLWKARKPQPSPATRKSIPLTALTTTTMGKKD